MNRDLVALGSSNMLAGLSPGFVQSGGASQTMANERAGGKTQLATLVAAGLILLTGAFFTGLFKNLPEATLAAIVIVAISSFWKVGELRRLARIRRSAIVLALTALFGVLIAGVLPGLILAAVLSLVLVIQRLSRPTVGILARDAASGVWGNSHRHPGWKLTTETLVVRADGPLFYANATNTKEHIVDLVAQAEPRPRRGRPRSLGQHRARRPDGRHARRALPDPRGRRRRAAARSSPRSGTRAARASGPHRTDPDPPDARRSGLGAVAMTAIVPRWEWRAFGDGLDEAAELSPRSKRRAPRRATSSISCPTAGDESVKIRAGLLDLKLLVRRDEQGLELWFPELKATFPISAADLEKVLAALGAPIPLTRAAYTLPELLDEVIGPAPGLEAVEVHKHRRHFELDGCLAESTELTTSAGTTRTVVIESEDPERVLATRSRLGLTGRPNVSFARGLKSLVRFGGRRYAVLDIGTNSVKFTIGEREADGSWKAVIDRAEVTRLGEGLSATGRLGAEPIGRTVRPWQRWSRRHGPRMHSRSRRSEPQASGSPPTARS